MWPSVGTLTPINPIRKKMDLGVLRREGKWKGEGGGKEKGGERGSGRGEGGAERGEGAPMRGIEGIGSDADVREWLQKHALVMVSCDSLPAAYFQEPEDFVVLDSDTLGSRFRLTGLWMWFAAP